VSVDPDGRIRQDLAGLLDRMQSLLLASQSEAGEPLATYTPYVLTTDGSGFWILISALAGHAQNLQARPRCSVLIIEDEQDVTQIYLRARCQYRCDAHGVDRSDPDWTEGLAALKGRFGAFIDTLAALQDFQLFRLEPLGGRYIVGFGRAFTLASGQVMAIESHIGPPSASNDGLK